MSPFYNSTKFKLIFCGATIVVMSSSLFMEQVKSPLASAVDLQYTDFASTSPNGRQLELGTVIPSKEFKNKEVSVIMKDPAMSQKWGLEMTDSAKAWRVSQGSKDIVVAIIDTGADVNHPDLNQNLWINPGETGLDKNGKDKRTNGIDDDRNGFVDDIHGFNFVSNNHNLEDNHGHGTHIAGIVGAVGGNGVGISGVSPNVSLMILKYYDPKAPGVNNLMNTVRAIDYAVKMKADIINYSGGGIEKSPQELEAIRRAEKQGILVVAAAGNEKSNSDIHGYFPADYDLDNIISVTAIDKARQVLDSSNYGKNSVDLAAPGNNIYSLLPDGQYGYMTGTSQATAFVSGVAALLMAADKDLKRADRIIKYLTQTGDIDPSLEGKTIYTKRLNSYKALATKDSDATWNGVRLSNGANFGSGSFSVDSDSSQGIVTGTGGAEANFASQTRNILKYIEQDTKQKIRGPSETVNKKPRL